MNDGMPAVAEHLLEVEDMLIEALQIVEEKKQEMVQEMKGETGPEGKQGPPGPAGKDGKDGRPGRDGKDGRDGADGRDGVDGRDGNDGSPDAGEDIVDKINNLPTDDDEYKIDASHIKNLPRGTGGEVRVIGNPTNLVIRDEGTVVQENVRDIDFVGSGVSAAVVNGRTTVTISGGGSGSTVTTPTGSVNGSNVTFTISASITPVWIIADGITYFSGAGYSYSSGVITMVSPPNNYIRVIS